MKAKIAVINFSGNVGKSTVAGQLLKPRMDNAQIFSIESINNGLSSNDGDIQILKGKNFKQLMNEIIPLDAAIVDVGASNVEDFIKLMQQHVGSHEEFDYFVIPVVKENKVQLDTLHTIEVLRTIGIEDRKIRIIFNKLDIDDIIEDEFEILFGLNLSPAPKAVIFENEVYENLKGVGKSLADLISDNTDYRAKLRQATDQNEKSHCLLMISMKRLALSANKNLETAFQTAFA